jgi:hypothetical protein
MGPYRVDNCWYLPLYCLGSRIHAHIELETISLQDARSKSGNHLLQVSTRPLNAQNVRAIPGHSISHDPILLGVFDASDRDGL